MLSLLSLSIERALHAPSAEHVRVIVRIDGVDVSHADGDDGLDLWDALVPVNRFVATDDFTTATIACCPSCGPECCAIEARVRREGDVVRWELGDRRGVRWVGEQRTMLFDAVAYDAEVARIEADHSWETAMHPAGRLILADVDLPSGVVALTAFLMTALALEVKALIGTGGWLRGEGGAGGRSTTRPIAAKAESSSASMAARGDSRSTTSPSSTGPSPLAARAGRP
ncbi:hypothetical protein ACPPVO_54220 [Dactylosporangium sp. McL0621]|uniref:hypothetical protein n=1 Tax=Dactylosporangium sp. McL0621 TaxID=3415678 RepID=UPI003CED3238